MLRIFTAYKDYPFHVPPRVRFLNLFRFIFLIPFLERFLIARLQREKKWWRRLVPPLYFYNSGSSRKAERNHIVYLLDISRLLDHSIYFYKVNEPTWENLFKYLNRDFVVLDIGANIGFLSLNFARACPDGFVFSFEPDSQNFNNLQTNIKLNGFENIKMFKKALGEKSGDAVLFKMYPNNPGANRILSTSPEQSRQHENVEVAALDDIDELKSTNRIDLIKIDVEGYEIFVLRGGRKFIEKWKPVLFVELAEINLRQQGHSALSLIEFIEGLGYEIKDARDMKEIDRNKTNHHTDILCIPKKNT